MKACRDCAATIYPKTWRRPPAETDSGRSLCRPCWRVRSLAGTLDDVERTKFTRDELMAEWDVLRGEGHTKRQAAERLGISYERFDRAYCRARAAGDPRAWVPGWSTPRAAA